MFIKLYDHVQGHNWEPVYWIFSFLLCGHQYPGLHREAKENRNSLS